MKLAELTALLRRRIEHLRGYNNRLVDNSRIRKERDEAGVAAIIIPKSDWTKEPAGKWLAVILMGWFLGLPAILFINMVDLEEVLAEFGVDGILWKIAAYVVVIGPWSFVLNLFIGLTRDIFKGCQEVRINRTDRTVTYYDSFSFRVFGFRFVEPTRLTASLDEFKVVLKPPFRFMDITFGEETSLYLKLAQTKKTLAGGRTEKDRRKIYNFIAKHMNQ